VKTKRKLKNVIQPRSVKVDELLDPIRVSFAQNMASLLSVQAAVGMSELGVIRRIFMLCCTPNRQNCSQSEQAEKFRTNPGIIQCLWQKSPISPSPPCVLTQQTA